MTNSIYLALYFTFLICLVNQINSVSIKDMESSIKSLSQNHLKKLSSSLLIKNTTDSLEIETLTNNTQKNTHNHKEIDTHKDYFYESKNEKQFSLSECELITDGPICLFNGDRVFLPAAKPKNLIGHWSFDDLKPLDNSGNNNHAIHSVKVGPAMGGVGHSAYFSKGEFLEIPHNKQFESGADFSITFWFYLINEPKKNDNTTMIACPLIQKGSDDLLNNSYNRYPAIFLDRKEKSFNIYTKTDNQNASEGEALVSNARVANEKWLHIALLKKKTKILFYVNGILDAKMDLKGAPIMNTGNLFVGGTPTLQNECKFPFLIDELRFYNYAIDEDYVQAEASPALGWIEPNFLQLGCIDCGIEEAINSCNEGYKLCSSIEMHTAGYQISRAMGWLKFDTHIWTHGALSHEKVFEGKKGLALCCVEIK